MLQLEQLKVWYGRYEDFWSEWKTYTNTMNKKEVIAIEIYRDNNFLINSKALEMFYERDLITQHLIDTLVKWLHDNYENYKKMIVKIFQISLIKKALDHGWDDFFNTPIYKLKIDEDFKGKLKSFSCKTIQQIQWKYANDFGYCNEKVFLNVLKFKDSIKAELSKETNNAGSYLRKKILNKKIKLDINECVI
ncbi:hypothetical protein CNR22_20365 [Sphingobacteriaceae bacterium]|nr:hypothetical protein CNR22_20365 [Sphingobacteriaceae bacterium]